MYTTACAAGCTHPAIGSSIRIRVLVMQISETMPVVKKAWKFCCVSSSSICTLWISVETSAQLGAYCLHWPGESDLAVCLIVSELEPAPPSSMLDASIGSSVRTRLSSNYVSETMPIVKKAWKFFLWSSRTSSKAFLDLTNIFRQPIFAHDKMFAAKGLCVWCLCCTAAVPVWASTHWWLCVVKARAIDWKMKTY